MTDPMLVLFTHVGLLLGTALLLGRFAVRLGLPAVAGELLAGVVIGPAIFGLVPVGALGGAGKPPTMLAGVVQFGVILLVGVTAAYLDLGVLRRRGRAGLTVSIGGLVVPVALGVGAGFLAPAELLPPGTDRALFASFLGVALGVSAIPVIAKILSDLKLLHRDIGQLIMVAGVVDDAVGWFGLSVVSAVATAGARSGTGAGSMGPVGRNVLLLIVFLVLMWLLGRPLIRALARALRSNESGEGPVLALAVLVILAGAACTTSIGAEPLFGAFVAGLVVGTSGILEPPHLAALRTVVFAVFGPLFLAGAGLRLSPGALTDPVVLFSGAALLAVAMIGKVAGAYAGARVGGLSRWEGLALGAGLNARGVVQIVIAAAGLQLGVLTQAGYTVIVLVALTTSLIAGPLLRYTTARIPDLDVRPGLDPDDRPDSSPNSEALLAPTETRGR